MLLPAIPLAPATCKNETVLSFAEFVGPNNLKRVLLHCTVPVESSVQCSPKATGVGFPSKARQIQIYLYFLDADLPSAHVSGCVHRFLSRLSSLRATANLHSNPPSGAQGDSPAPGFTARPRSDRSCRRRTFS